MMKVTKTAFDQAVANQIISGDQAAHLIAFFEAQPQVGPRLNFTNVLYYMGGLIAISAMTVLLGLGWESFGGWGMLGVALVYAGAGLTFAAFFQKRGAQVPAGICAAFVIALTPLAVYGLMQAMGWWPDDSYYQNYYSAVKWCWVYLEIGTLAVGGIMFYFFRYPFLELPIVVTLWFLSMDFTALIVGGHPDFSLQSRISMCFGAAVVFFSLWVDIRSKTFMDYAFWMYLLGVTSFWGGLTFQYPDHEGLKFVYFCTNIFLLGMGAVIARRVFVIFGAIGCAIYLGHLAYDLFADSCLFPVVLSAIGLGIIYLGRIWQINEGAINMKVRSVLPLVLGQFFEQRAE